MRKSRAFSFKVLLVVAMVMFLSQCESTSEGSDENNSLKFLVLGDWGKNGDSNQSAVANQLAKAAKDMNAKFIITTGDNFYFYGVASTSDVHWQESFEKVYDDTSLFVPWYVSLGNHDYAGNVQAEIEYSNLSARWTLPSRYYVVDKVIDKTSTVRLVFIDTSPFLKSYWLGAYPNVIGQDTAAQWKWIDSVLGNSTANWNIVIGHHPIYSASPIHGNTLELIDRLKPIMEKYHAQAYFCGHEHDLEHLKEPNGSVHYLLSGGGSQIRQTGRDSNTLFSAASLGFMSVELFAGKMDVHFIDDKGDTLHSDAILNEK